MNIGQKVDFRICYERKCARRFTYPEGKLDPLREHDSNKFESGFVVGIRWVIMSDFSYHYGGNEEQSSVKGTVEKVLLVCSSIKTNPFVVRFQDVLK